MFPQIEKAYFRLNKMISDNKTMTESDHLNVMTKIEKDAKVAEIDAQLTAEEKLYSKVTFNIVELKIQRDTYFKDINDKNVEREFSINLLKMHSQSVCGEKF